MSNRTQFAQIALLSNLLSLGYPDWSAARALIDPVPVQRVNFEPSKNALAQHGLSSRMLNAVVSMELPFDKGQNQSKCSAFSVSSHGHLLTSGHCLEHCLSNAKLYKRDGALDRVDVEKVSGTICHIKINGELTEVEVLAANDCKLGDSRLVDGCPRLDYALLHIKARPSPDCFALSGSVPDYGTKVASIGFPMRTIRSTWRSDAKDSNGKQQYISMGKTIPPTPSCFKIVDQGSDERAGRRNFPPDLMSTRYAMDGVAKGEYIQTEGADILHGSSGGPLVIPATGIVAGIASFGLGGLNQSEFSECEGATFFTSVAPLIHAINKDFPKLDLSAAFKCDSPIGL